MNPTATIIDKNVCYFGGQKESTYYLEGHATITETDVQHLQPVSAFNKAHHNSNMIHEKEIIQ